jgi:two-component system, LytTR family, response regulator
MKLRALLVDDEEDAATALKLLLEKTCPDLHISGIEHSALAAVKRINKEQVDVLFLDVEMPGENGFGLLDLLKGGNFYVIFTTAHSDYAIHAIKYGAKDYLLKPIDPDELVTAVKKAREHYAQTDKSSQLSRSEPTISVATSKGISFLKKENIVFVKANGRYSEINCADGSVHLICKNIGEYENELRADHFFRVHKSFLINCKRVLKINSLDGGFVEMDNHKEIEISKRKKKEFIHFLRKN